MCEWQAKKKRKQKKKIESLKYYKNEKCEILSNDVPRKTHYIICTHYKRKTDGECTKVNK